MGWTSPDDGGITVIIEDASSRGEGVNPDEQPGDVCPDCAGRVALDRRTHVTQVGNALVCDSEIYVPTCTECGIYYISKEIGRLYRLRAAVIFLRDESVPREQALRYARLAMNLRLRHAMAVVQSSAVDLCDYEEGALEAPPSVVRLMMLAAQAMAVAEMQRLDSGRVAPPVSTRDKCSKDVN